MNRFAVRLHSIVDEADCRICVTYEQKSAADNRASSSGLLLSVGKTRFQV